MINHYELLGVDNAATDEEIKKAYRVMSKKHHPDLNGNGSQALFAAVNLAYQVLADPASRSQYDFSLTHEGASEGRSNAGNNESSNSSQRKQQEEPYKEEPYKEEHYVDDIAQTPVYWDDYDWKKKDFSQLTESLANPRPHMFSFAIFGTLFMFMLLASFLAFTSYVLGNTTYTTTNVFYIAVFFAGQAGMVKAWVEYRFYGSLLTFPIILGAWTGLSIFWSYYIAYPPSGGNPIKFVIVAVITFIIGVLSVRSSKKYNSEKIHEYARFKVSKKSALDSFQWGEAGNLDDAIGKFGAENVHKGSVGEKYTESLLQEMAKIPGVRLMHGLKFPGSKTADVDHVLVSGNKVIFIDSKQWSRGQYWWGNSETIYQEHRGRKTTRSSNFSKAVKGYIRQLPARAEVHSVILVHGVGIEVVGEHKEGITQLMNTRDGINYIGEHATAGATGQIDAPILNLLVNAIKS